MPARKPTTKAGKRKAVKQVMDEYKAGTLRSGSKSGPKVRNPKQALAIALKESGASRSRGQSRSQGQSRKRRA